MLRRDALMALGGVVLGCASTSSRAPLAKPPAVPTRGSGRLVIQEAGDYQCPFCAKAQPMVHALLDRFRGQVQLVWRDYPLDRHFDAHLAAQAAREVSAQLGSDAFWAFHDRLFENQFDLGPRALQAYAEQVGVDGARFEEAVKAQRHADAVDLDRGQIDAYLEREGVGSFGTPAFFIGRQIVVGTRPIDVMAELVEDELA